MSSIRTPQFNSSVRDIQLIMGLFLILVSTGALVMTLQSLMQDWVSKTFSIMAGIALQICLYLFANNPNHRVRWFSALLMLLSIIATTWFMETTWQQQHHQRLETLQQKSDQSWQAEQYRQQIVELNQEIAISTQSAQEDINKDFRKRGNNTLVTLDQKKTQRESLNRKLNNITSEDNQTLTPTAFEATPEIRITLFALIALLIDVTAIMAIGSWITETKLTEKEPQPLSEKPSTHDSHEPDPMDCILEKIRSGEYGEFVPVKQIVETEPVRHPELKAGIDRLMDEGVLTKTGNRYRHTRFEKQAELAMN